MTRKSMVREFLNTELTDFRIHLINLSDESRGGCYNQIRAKEKMMNKSLERWAYYWNEKKYNTHETNVIFTRWNNREARLYDPEKTRHSKSNPEFAKEFYPEYKTIEHNSMWDFFNFIKYDYKNNKVSNIDTLIFIKKIEKEKKD